MTVNCPTCKTAVTTSDPLAPGAIGICTKATCGKKFRWPLYQQDIYTALGSLGHQVGKSVYEQGARRKAFGYTNPEVQNGFCHSACLDWARRVVQGGRINFAPSETDKSGTARSSQQIRAREEAQTDRAVKIHLNFAKGNIKTGSPWKSLKNSLDTGYLGGKKRTFGQIDQIYCEFNLNLGNMTEVLNHLTSKTGFSTNCCAILSFDYFGGGGHAVGVYQTNTSRFVLFDPNYTTFEYENIDKLCKALSYLFVDAVYPSGGSNWNGKLDMFVYSNNAPTTHPPPVVQTITLTHQQAETTSVLNPPIETIPVPLATQPNTTSSPTSGQLQEPGSGASIFKQNLWKMLNDTTRRDGDYVQVAYSQKKDIEKNGGSVTSNNKCLRTTLVEIYNKVA